MNDLQKEISEIQLTLKAPKKQFNKFANFYYRNAEDILEALKPLLKEHNLFQKVTDEVVRVGDANYIKSTVSVSLGELTETACGWAREEESLKGQIAAQITGGASSYAKKYALNNMYNIDDSQDIDSQDSNKTKVAPKVQAKPALATEAQRKLISDRLAYMNFNTPEEIKHYLATEYGINGLLSKEDAAMVINDLNDQGPDNAEN